MTTTTTTTTELRTIAEINADLAYARGCLEGAHRDIAAHMEALRGNTAVTVRGTMAAAFDSQRIWQSTLNMFRAELEAHPEFEQDLFQEMFGYLFR